MCYPSIISSKIPIKTSAVFTNTFLSDVKIFVDVLPVTLIEC